MDDRASGFAASYGAFGYACCHVGCRICDDVSKRSCEQGTGGGTGVVGIRHFASAIRKLPTDKPVVTPGKWYLTQKEHWLGWLSGYDGPGAYGRKGGPHQDAMFAYNHIVEP